MNFLLSLGVRCRLLLLCIAIILIGTAHSAAQAPPATANLSGPQIDASAQTPQSSLASSPSSTSNAYNAWNELLRDVARLGLMAATQNNGGAMHAGPGGETGISGGAMQSGSSAAAMQAGAGNAPDGARGGSGGSVLNLGSLFQLAGSFSRALNGSGHSGIGSAVGVVPMLGQLTRGGLSMPVGSSLGSFRIGYQSPLSFSGMNGTSLTMRGYGSGSAAYDSPHMRSGRIDFSASAAMGVGASGGAGAPGGAQGGHGPGGAGGHAPGNSQSTPSASVSLHLSF